MACILKRHKLGHLNEVFQREKVTPDIVSHLSVHEMNQLGVNNKGDMMNFDWNARLSETGCPRETFWDAELLNSISQSPCLSIICKKDSRSKDIASMLSVSESTVYRRM